MKYGAGSGWGSEQDGIAGLAAEGLVVADIGRVGCLEGLQNENKHVSIDRDLETTLTTVEFWNFGISRQEAGG